MANPGRKEIERLKQDIKDREKWASQYKCNPKRAWVYKVHVRFIERDKRELEELEAERKKFLLMVKEA